MKQRGRKLFGTIITVLFLILYALAAMAIGGEYFVGQGRFVEFFYFVFAGFCWIPIAMMIIRWMAKSDA
jgi:Protein of unknown function (DUF2842)